MMKKITAIILVLTMMAGMGTTVFAEEGRVCVSETTYGEITDIDALIALAIEQNPMQFYNRSADDNNQIHVEQVIAKKEFADGSK